MSQKKNTFVVEQLNVNPCHRKTTPRLETQKAKSPTSVWWDLGKQCMPCLLLFFRCYVYMVQPCLLLCFGDFLAVNIMALQTLSGSDISIYGYFQHSRATCLCSTSWDWEWVAKSSDFWRPPDRSFRASRDTWRGVREGLRQFQQLNAFWSTCIFSFSWPYIW